MAAASTPPRVVVLGGGFAGLGAARKLKKASAEVVLVDANDYHSFQPMLYQLATGLVETTAVAHPLRDLFHEQPNARVHQARVAAVDVDRRTVSFEDMAPLDYDYLVFALGAGVEFFGVEGAAEHAFPLYTVADAVRLKEHLLRRWEEADRHPELIEDGALDVVVVGGGPTGVETVGALAELYASVLIEDFPAFAGTEARIWLVEAGPTLLSMFKPVGQKYATRALEERGADIRLGEVVQSIGPTRVLLRSGEELPAHTTVWAAGLHGSPIAESLGVRLEHGGRIPVEPDLRVGGNPTLFAVGDSAWITDAKTGNVLPQLGSVALQAGEHAGTAIAQLLDAKPTEPFGYHDKGTMAAIGRGAAVVQLHDGRTIKGRSAMLAWGAVHLALLSTGEDRTKTAIDWAWAGFSHERSHRIHVDTTSRQRS